MLLVEAVLIGLAAWRLAALISYERGPGGVFLRFRKLLGFEHGEDGEPTAWPSNILTEMVACVWCLAFWMAVLCWGFWELEPLIVVVIAAAAVAVIVERWSHG